MLNIKNVMLVSVQDWDALVIETYKRRYNYQQQDGCKDRGIVEFSVPVENAEDYDFENDNIEETINGDEMGVSFKAWLSRDPMEWNGDSKDARHLDLFWRRNFYPSIEVIANDLFQKGLIPAGNYVINIDW